MLELAGQGSLTYHSDMTILSSRRSGPASSTPLVLLHAMPLDSTMWDRVRSILSECDILTIDAPGFGASGTGEELQARFGYEKPAIGAIVQGVHEVTQSLGLTRFALGGLSMGGTVAAAYTMRYPREIAGLALMDTNIGTDLPEHRQMRIDGIAAAEAGDGYSSVKDWVTTMTSPASSDQVRASLDERFRRLSNPGLAWLQKALMTRPDSTAAVEAFDGPLLVERGEDDSTTTHQQLEEWAARHPGTRVVEIPQAGHFVADEQPEALADVLREFYSDVLESEAARNQSESM